MVLPVPSLYILEDKKHSFIYIMPFPTTNQQHQDNVQSISPNHQRQVIARRNDMPPADRGVSTLAWPWHCVPSRPCCCMLRARLDRQTGGWWHCLMLRWGHNNYYCMSRGSGERFCKTDRQARKLNKEDAMDHSRWRKWVKDV